jgi:hypothetical protein
MPSKISGLLLERSVVKVGCVHVARSDDGGLGGAVVRSAATALGFRVALSSTMPLPDLGIWCSARTSSLPNVRTRPPNPFAPISIDDPNALLVP